MSIYLRWCNSRTQRRVLISVICHTDIYYDLSAPYTTSINDICLKSTRLDFDRFYYSDGLVCFYVSFVQTCFRGKSKKESVIVSSPSKVSQLLFLFDHGLCLLYTSPTSYPRIHKRTHAWATSDEFKRNENTFYANQASIPISSWLSSLSPSSASSFVSSYWV